MMSFEMQLMRAMARLRAWLGALARVVPLLGRTVPRRAVILVLAIFLVLVIVMIDAAGSRRPASQEPAADPSLAAEQLALRLLLVEREPFDVQLELRPGQAAPGLESLTLPEGTRLLGSLLYRDGEGRLLRTEAAYDVPLATDETIAFLQQQFSEQGWKGWLDPVPGGFTPEQADLTGVACRPDGRLILYLTALYVPAGPTDLRLSADHDPGYDPCPAEGVRLGATQVSPLPSLRAPEGARTTVHGWIEADGQLSSSAYLETDLTSQALLDHYGSQLAAAGWQLVDRSEGPASGSSRWEVRADSGIRDGLFTVSTIHERGYLLGLMMVPRR